MSVFSNALATVSMILSNFAMYNVNLFLRYISATQPTTKEVVMLIASIVLTALTCALSAMTCVLALRVTYLNGYIKGKGIDLPGPKLLK